MFDFISFFNFLTSKWLAETVVLRRRESKIKHYVDYQLGVDKGKLTAIANF